MDIADTGETSDDCCLNHHRGSGPDVSPMMMAAAVAARPRRRGEHGPSSRPGSPEKVPGGLLYGVDDVPAPGVIIVYALQQAVASVAAGPLMMAYLVHKSITCGRPDDVMYAQLIASTIFMCGLTTLVQILLGTRLPIRQGSCFNFLAPILAMMATDQWRCPQMLDGEGDFAVANGTDVLGGEAMWNETLTDEPLWKPRMQLDDPLTLLTINAYECAAAMLSGGLVTASLVQVLLGVTGAAGRLMHYIGPLTLVPCVALIGFSLYPNLVHAAEEHWGVAGMSLGLFLVFSLLLERVETPYLTYGRGRGGGGWTVAWYPLFKVFPLVFALVISWLVCYILTVTDTLPSDPSHHGYLARTDAKADVLGKVVWFYVPYPGQWGWPTYGVAIFVGALAATIASIIESLGDYVATARVCRVAPPPAHALNRGVLAEGLGGVLAGFMGICHSTTSYSESIGFIAITGTASRAAWLAMACVMLALGVLSKFAAALATIPDPIIGGLSLPSIAMVTSVALSNLQHVSLASSRNLLILGLALLLGLGIPEWVRAHPDAVKTGNVTLDQVLWVFLTTAMFMGGFIGFVLDNLTPGTKEERGIEVYCEPSTTSPSSTLQDKLPREYSIYRLPWIGEWLDRTPWTAYIPISSSYHDRGGSGRGCLRKSRCNKCRSKRRQTTYDGYP